MRKSFKINRSARNISDDEKKKMIQDLSEDMRSDRLQHDRRMEHSMELARGFTTND